MNAKQPVNTRAFLPLYPILGFGVAEAWALTRCVVMSSRQGMDQVVRGSDVAWVCPCLEGCALVVGGSFGRHYLASLAVADIKNPAVRKKVCTPQVLVVHFGYNFSTETAYHTSWEGGTLFSFTCPQFIHRLRKTALSAMIALYAIFGR